MPSAFKSTKRIRSITYVRTGGRWKSTFASTSYIYGLEMVAVLTDLMEKGPDLANRSVTSYIDNNHALLAIHKNSANPISVHATTGLIWNRIRELNINPRVERVPSKRNIADLRTRSVEIKHLSLKRCKFRMAIALRKLTEWAIARIPNGLPIEPTSMKNRTPVSPLGNKTGWAQKIFKQEVFSIGNECKATALRTSDPVHRTLVKSQTRYPPITVRGTDFHPVNLR